MSRCTTRLLWIKVHHAVTGLQFYDLVMSMAVSCNQYRLMAAYGISSTQSEAVAVSADKKTGNHVLAAHLLLPLWHLQPSMVSEFVSDGHLPSLLQQLADSTALEEGLCLIQLLQTIWSSTTALASEPLLVAAINQLVGSCYLEATSKIQVPDDSKHLALDTQVY